jgi:trans-aconitate 2-methyltransferase
MPYLFGDSDPAASRLEIVHRVFRDSSQALLERLADREIELAIDLGCGPGLCTELLFLITGCRRAVGLDAAASFIDLANARPHPGIKFVTHDVTSVPFPTGPADLLYARLLVGHLAEPDVAVARWSTQLRTGGRLVIEEVEAMNTEHPVLRRYLHILAQLQSHHGLAQCFGPTLDAMAAPPGCVPELSQVAKVPVASAVAASMFRINLRTWRQDDFVRSLYSDREIDELQDQLDHLSEEPPRPAEILWGMRQVVFQRAE